MFSDLPEVLGVVGPGKVPCCFWFLGLCKMSWRLMEEVPEVASSVESVHPTAKSYLVASVLCGSLLKWLGSEEADTEAS